MQVITPDLCDAHPMDVQVAAPIFKNFGAISSFFGPILTIKCFEDNSLVKEQLNQPGNGQVLVVDGGGSTRCALLGDQLAEKAKKNQWAGVIVYGCVRDVDILAEIPVGIQAIAAMPLKSVRKGRGDLNIPVNFANIYFKPGEYVYADNNGIITSERLLES